MPAPFLPLREGRVRLEGGVARRPRTVVIARGAVKREVFSFDTGLALW